MKTYLDCIPCFVRHTLDAGRMVCSDEKIHEKLLKKVLLKLSNIDMKWPPPYMAKHIHALIRKTMGVDDPYKNIKIEHNKMALKLYPRLKSIIKTSSDPLNTAMRLAMAGNIIDLGVKNNITEQDVENSIIKSIKESFIGDYETFKRMVIKAKQILYLSDNAGEIVFDKLFIEEIGPEKIILGVRGGPIINDATIEDADLVGLSEIVKVIDNGSDAPGTILEDCKKEFMDVFWQADLIIAKGQGNFESLSNIKHNIFFLFKAKCNIIANHAKVKLGSFVLTQPIQEDKNL